MAITIQFSRYEDALTSCRILTSKVALSILNYLSEQRKGEYLGTISKTLKIPRRATLCRLSDLEDIGVLNSEWEVDGEMLKRRYRLNPDPERVQIG